MCLAGHLLVLLERAGQILGGLRLGELVVARRLELPLVGHLAETAIAIACLDDVGEARGVGGKLGNVCRRDKN